MAPSRLFVDTYTVPPYPTTTGDPDPLKQLWSPTVITILHTTTSILICDCPPTIIETTKLADWIEATFPTKKVKYFFATHAHGDHFFGFPTLETRFQGIVPLATKAVAGSAGEQYEGWWGPKWQEFFPDGQLPSKRVVFDPLPENNKFDFEGFELEAHDVQHADTHANSFLHVPALKLVVACDIVYGDCYQFLVEASTAAKRQQWLDAREAIEKLQPQIVIPGHARKSQVLGAYLIEQTRTYIREFAAELKKAESAEDLYERVKALYPERWNLFLLQLSCEASFRDRGK